ncbi:putative nuclease HARBI1 [Rhopalosiphum maidis]|uniref:putative nuclease HARBI1 n=1 Tax=Rhopalosiphum maidis TaxID=43146 RepID=UPI000EFDE05B|nr:putative nuclease HARBI1 [Rhopalosiphum maidis]
MENILIQCSPNAGSEYYNYKGFHSIVLQAVVDANAKFIAIDIGDYGRNSDSGIFKKSNFEKLLKNNKLNIPQSKKIDPQINDEFPFVFVVDEAYPLQTNLMRPFPRRNLTNEKRIFNYRLSRARRIVECVFGILVKRFNVLENKMLVFLKKLL